MSRVARGDVVKIHYTGRLEDGTVFDSSEGRDPLEFAAGSTDIISGFSNAVIGMEAGQKQTIKIEPDDGYGDRRDELLKEVALDVLPEEVKVGDVLQAQTESGATPVWIVEMRDETALLDGNHPLAGKTLEFDIELVEVEAVE